METKTPGVLIPMRTDLTQFCLTPAATIRQVITLLNKNQAGIVLLTDDGSRLLGTVTDGDIRRAILEGLKLESPVGGILERKKAAGKDEPVTAQSGMKPEDLLQCMQEKSIRQIPIVDSERRVCGLVTLDELLPEQILPFNAVIMAGGFGKRLYPLTEGLPKPMLPVGDKPIMEHIIAQLRLAGIRNVNITTHYQPEKITDYFGNGETFGVNLNYVAEDRPLGTAGALSLLEKPDSPLLVINGDVLTGVDFRSMHAYHREQGADLTVGVRQYDFQVPYGVIECDDGVRVSRVREKPSVSFFVNAGIYLLEPAAHRSIPSGQKFDMTDLIHLLVEEGRTVVSFPIIEYWLDIGQHGDYEKAQEDLKNGKVAFTSRDH